MTYGPDYLKEQARKAAERRLRQAATFVALPGLLKLIDPETGEILAISLPGKPSVLSPDFVPMVPALAGTQGDRN